MIIILMIIFSNIFMKVVFNNLKLMIIFIQVVFNNLKLMIIFIHLVNLFG
jgi:hypothetical protein